MSEAQLATDPNAGAQPAPAANPTPAPTKADAPTRPDFLPENYWDGDKGSAKLDALFNDLTASKTELARFESISAQAPAKAEDYQIALPEKLELPDGVQIELDPQNEQYKDLLNEFRAFAHENKLSQAQFSGQLGLFARYLANNAAKAQAYQADQMKAIGENASSRITAVEKYVSAALPKGQAEAVLGTLTSKAALEGFEALIRKASPARAGTDGDVTNGAGGDKYEGLFGARRRAAQLADQKQHIRA